MSDKPPFNPNAAFQPVDDKPAFDPSQPHTVIDEAPQTYTASDYEVPSTPTPLTKLGRDRAMIQSAMAKPGDITRAVENGAAMMTGGGLAKAAGKEALGLIGNSAEGALAGAAQASPEDRARGAAIGGVLPAGLGVAGKVLGSAARPLIQKAMGIKEPSAAIGQQMLDQGIWGTRKSMGNQVQNALGTEGQGLNDAVNKLGGAVEVAPLAQKLDTAGGQLAIDGSVPPALQGKYNKFANEANYLGEQGAMTPQDLLKYKQMQGNNAYSMRGSPLTSDEAQISNMASKEAGDLLKAKYAEQFPGESNAIADQNAKLSALFKAKSGLEKGPNLVDYLKGAGATGAAGHFGGPAAAALMLAAKSSLGQSGTAQLLNLLKQGTEKVDPAVLRTILLSHDKK